MRDSSVREARRREPAVACQQPSVYGAHKSGIAGGTATNSARLSQPWQRHSEAGAAARAEAVVAPPGPTRPGCARSRQGTEFAGSRFRSSTVTFVRRHRPYQRLPRSGSPGCCSARASGHLIAAALSAAPFPFHKPGAGCAAYPRCWRSRRTAISSSHPIEQTPTSGCISSSTPTTDAHATPAALPSPGRAVVLARANAALSELVPGGSEACDERDAPFLRVAEETVLAGIVPIQRPASVRPTAVRAR